MLEIRVPFEYSIALFVRQNCYRFFVTSIEKTLQNAPRERLALRMGWHHLLFLHWQTDADALQKRVPRALKIETFDGAAYIGLVPFSMTRVRPRVLPGLPFAPQLYENFHETNVRTYVRHRATGERGVWFFSLDAANLPAVLAARLWFKLPYFWSQMKLEIARDRNEQIIEYSNRRVWPSPNPCGCNVRIRVRDEAPHLAERETLEHFFIERYTLFSGHDNALFRGRVRHKPYRLQNATVENCSENLIRAANIEYSNQSPHVLYAREARVEAFALQPAAL